MRSSPSTLRRLAVALTAGWVVVGSVGLALGQDPPEPEPGQQGEGDPDPAPDGTDPVVEPPPIDEPVTERYEQVTVAIIQSRMALVVGATDLDDVSREALLTKYREAEAQLGVCAQWAERVADMERIIAEAPARLEAGRLELAQSRAEVAVQAPPDASLAQIDQSLTQAEADLRAARERLETRRAEPSRRNDRRAVLSEEISSTRQRLDELETRLLTPLAPDATRQARANRTLASVQRLAAIQELRAKELEVQRFDATVELLQVLIDRELRAVTTAEELVAAWQQLVAERRREETERAAEEARQLQIEAARQSSALRELAENNQDLAERRSLLNDRLENIDLELNQTKGLLASVRERFSSSRRKEDAVGLTQAMGLVLRHEREQLDDVTHVQRRSRLRQDEIAAVQFELIVLQEKREEAADVEAELARLLAEAQAEDPDRDLTEYKAVAQDLLTARRTTLDSLIGDTTLYFNRLIDLERESQALLAASAEYRTYIEERILWVPSLSGDGSPEAAWDAAHGLTSQEEWGQAISLARADVDNHLPQSVAMALALVALLPLSLWSRRRLHQLAERMQGRGRNAFNTTVQAVMCTVTLAVFPAAGLAVLGWHMNSPPDQSELALALAEGVQKTAVILFLLELLRQMVRVGGLGEAHFRWAPDGLRRLRRDLTWFMPIKLLTTFMVATLDQAPPAWNDSLGRAAFAAGSLALALFLLRGLSPSGPMLKGFLARNQRGWATRLRHFWFALAVGLPLLLTALAGLGYYYAAVQLQWRLEQSLALILGLALGNSLLLRWLSLARRRIALEEAMRATSDEGPVGGGGGGDERHDHEDEIDLKAMSAQTQQLFTTAFSVAFVLGMFFTWSDVLPALRRLDRVQLYPELKLTENKPRGGPAAAPAANASTPPVGGASEEDDVAAAPDAEMMSGLGPAPEAAALIPTEHAVITLADLGLAILALLVTLASARNVPALLEIVLLQRLPLDAGARYAISSVSRYAIVIGGVVISFSLIGIGWNQVQWLAAALTFGLAFGLQEIFANFVSGLILFFERPVRVGDWVTVGETTGVVTRIQIRATTILDHTHKELVIPNREFVTGHVVNWSLTSTTLRLIVPVGIAYGSDTGLARRTLIEVASSLPQVLKDPPPRAFFMGFGGSSLDFELHCGIRHPEDRWAVRDLLHEAVDQAFRNHGIEIAFPQQDLHVRSAAGLRGLLGAPEPALPAPAPPRINFAPPPMPTAGPSPFTKRLTSFTLSDQSTALSKKTRRLDEPQTSDSGRTLRMPAGPVSQVPEKVETPRESTPVMPLRRRRRRAELDKLDAEHPDVPEPTATEPAPAEPTATEPDTTEPDATELTPAEPTVPDPDREQPADDEQSADEQPADEPVPTASQAGDAMGDEAKG
jgi:potassium-dependent mechanosensitive channel